MSTRRTIGTRSKSRDEMDSAEQDAKENVENDQSSSSDDFRPPSPSTTTPAASKREMTPSAKASTAKTSRSAASLFSPSYSRTSPPLYSDSQRHHPGSGAMRRPDPFPDNWEEDMCVPQAPSSSSRRNRREGAPQDSFATPYSMSQVRWIERETIHDAWILHVDILCLAR